MAQTTAPLGQVLRRYVSQVIVAVDGSGSEEEQDTSPPNKMMSVRQSSALKMHNPCSVTLIEFHWTDLSPPSL